MGDLQADLAAVVADAILGAGVDIDDPFGDKRPVLAAEIAQELNRHFQQVDRTTIWAHVEFCVDDAEYCTAPNHDLLKDAERPVFVFSLKKDEK